MKAKIVVADDEPRIRKMIARLLTDEGYDVMPVENGREAVEALLSFQPDVILLDQQMPVLTGVEALEEIRRISPTQVVLFVKRSDFILRSLSVLNSFLSSSNCSSVIFVFGFASTVNPFFCRNSTAVVIPTFKSLVTLFNLIVILI